MGSVGRGVVLAALVTLSLGACGITDVVCTDEAVASLNVAVVDSVTGSFVTDAVVWVQDGVFTDTLMGGDGRWFGPWERAGVYAVNVESEAYRPWSRSGVEVEEGRCHVEPESLTARVRPLE